MLAGSDFVENAVRRRFLVSWMEPTGHETVDRTFDVLASGTFIPASRFGLAAPMPRPCARSFVIQIFAATSPTNIDDGAWFSTRAGSRDDIRPNRAMIRTLSIRPAEADSRTALPDQNITTPASIDPLFRPRDVRDRGSGVSGGRRNLLHRSVADFDLPGRVLALWWGGS
jgi:hypothetical protein